MWPLAERFLCKAMKLGSLARNLGFLVLKYDLYRSSTAVAVIAKACSRALALFLVISVAMAGRSWGLAEISCLANFMIFSSALGACSRVFFTLSEKTCERERIVGRSAAGCSVSRIK